jgi:toxin-antitoxin system PIN domain toxin
MGIAGFTSQWGNASGSGRVVDGGGCRYGTLAGDGGVTSADSNIFLYAADPNSPRHHPARHFLNTCGTQKNEEFVVCELVLVEVYMGLRNPAIFKQPYTSAEAAGYCEQLKKNPRWRCVDYQTEVSHRLWEWASLTNSGFRQIFDARLAMTLRHHGVTRFATLNEKHFQGFGFETVWNPLI